MYISDWLPPKSLDTGETHIHGGDEDGSVARPLMALVALVFIAVATMFIYDHSEHQFLACTTHATVEQCSEIAAIVAS